MRDGHYLRCLLPARVYADLRELQVARWRQKQQLNSVKNRVHGWLDVFFPEFRAVFKDITGKAAMWVLSNCPAPTMINAMPLAHLVKGLKGASCGRVGEKRALRLIEAAQRSIGVPEGLAGAWLRLKGYLEELVLYERLQADTEAAMAQALEKTGYAEYLLSIPGVGVVTAAGFLGEIGDPGRYESWRQVQKLAGLNLVEHSSGQYRGQRKISKRGRPRLRSLLYYASIGLVARNAEFRYLYDHFLSRGENPLKRKQALVAISLKLLRVVMGLLHNHETYDPAKVLGRHRQQQLGIAA